MLAAVTARPYPSCFLLTSSICCPLALQAYDYAIFFHRQSLHPEEGSSTDLWNVSILPQHCMVSQPITTL